MNAKQILDIDYRIEENKKELNKFLWKVKPARKLFEKNNYTKTQLIPLELLEQIIHGICKRYGYSQQGIKEYWENGEFVYYNCSVLNSKREWVGYVYGKALWELEAKLLIKIYAEIMKEKKENE